MATFFAVADVSLLNQIDDFGSLSLVDKFLEVVFALHCFGFLFAKQCRGSNHAFGDFVVVESDALGAFGCLDADHEVRHAHFVVEVNGLLSVVDLAAVEVGNRRVIAGYAFALHGDRRIDGLAALVDQNRGNHCGAFLVPQLGRNIAFDCQSYFAGVCLQHFRSDFVLN